MCGMKSKIKETLKRIKNKVNSNRKNEYQIEVNNNQRIWFLVGPTQKPRCGKIKEWGKKCSSKTNHTFVIDTHQTTM